MSGPSKRPQSKLEVIPGVGPQIAQELEYIGVHKVRDLKGADPEKLYRDLCKLRGTHIDRCVLYVFRCAVYFASSTVHTPELLKWWNWTDDRLGSI
jgi:hypothetical protein